jgi:hypothetical protein
MYACSLNNQGVDLLVSGESSRALTTFLSALSLLKKAAANETETTPCTDTNVSCDAASLPAFRGSASTVSGLQDLHGYVYDHGIMVTNNVNEEATDVQISLYIAIVLFNLAIASHCQGVELGREKLLKKASVLYSLVVQLLTKCTMPVDASTTILTMLALNNKAQIHYDQCEYVESLDCMKYISKIMGGCRGLHSALKHEDVWGLLLNVILLSTPSAAQAA